MRRFLLALVSLTLLATACGDDSVASAAAWCDAAQEVENVSDNLDTADDYRAFRDAVNDAKDSAPSEISDAVDSAAEFLDAMADALDDNDDNIILAVDDLQQNLDFADFDAAGDAITDYNATECGIGEVSDGNDDPSVDDLEADLSGSLVADLADQLGISEDDTRCLVEKLDITTGETPDVSSMFESLEECGIDPFSLATE
jgi:hypothetical protein